MAVTADFELGTNGNTIATGDAGSANAWNTVSIGGGATATYDNAHVHKGALAYKALAATSGQCYCQWSSGTIGTITTQTWGRIYLYVGAHANNNMDVVAGVNAAATVTCFKLRITSAGVLLILNAAGTTIATFATSIPTGQWMRLEWQVTPSTTVGAVEAKLFTTAESTTATETQTTINQVLAANLGIYRIGFGTIGLINTTGIWIDDILVNAAAYPGPTAQGAPPFNHPRNRLITR